MTYKSMCKRAAVRMLVCAGVAVLVGVGTPRAFAAEGSIKHAAKQLGHATSKAVHQIGHSAKKFGKAIAHDAEKTGKAIGAAARAGNKAFKEKMDSGKH